MESTANFKNTTETSKNLATWHKTVPLVVFLAFSMLIAAIALVESTSCHNRCHRMTPTTTPSVHPIIKKTCSKTLYPSLCFTTLSSISASKNDTTSQQMLEMAINRTMASVVSTQSQIVSLFTDQDLNSQEKNALNDCIEMMDQTLYELGQGVDDLYDASASISFLYRSYGNLKTLLSAAMTNVNTCIDGLSDVEEADPERQKGLKKHLQRLLIPISHMTSNCLAMVKYMESINRGDNYNDRKILISKASPGGFPEWMTPVDREIMEMAPDIRPDVVVAHDGTGVYRTIGDAVRMAPNMSMNRYVIKINAGVYNETVVITREKTNIMLVGDGMNSTMITGCRNFVDGFSTFTSATLTVVGDRFLARDLTIINSSGPQKHQAVALRVNSNSAFYRCNFSSYQDTLYAHSLRQFYRECTVEGTVDFIFGNAAAVFQNCLIRVRKPDSGQKNMITAQGREDPNQNTGISLQNCTIMAAPDLSTAANRGRASTFLGRPWRNHSRTMVMKSYLGNLIHPQGWRKWNEYSTLDTIEYIEYMNTGPGSNTRHRVTWRGYTRNCSEDVAKQFTVQGFLRGGYDWLDSTGFPLSYGP